MGRRYCLTLTGDVVVHYQDYVIRADKVVYNRETTELEADGHLQVHGGPNDVLINATHGDMRLNMHTARFYNVNGSQGVRSHGTHGRVLHTDSAAVFRPRAAADWARATTRSIDGSITNCRLPHPDWRIIAHSISLDNEEGVDLERILRVSRRSDLLSALSASPGQ